VPSAFDGQERNSMELLDVAGDLIVSILVLDEPGPPFDEQLLAQAVDEPLIPEEVAGHIDVSVVKQNARFLARSHDGLVEFGHG